MSFTWQGQGLLTSQFKEHSKDLRRRIIDLHNSHRFQDHQFKQLYLAEITVNTGIFYIPSMVYEEKMINMVTAFDFIFC